LRGFARLPKANAGDLFFDIEGDPLFDDGPLDYLFGFDYIDGGETKFTAFWAHSREEEKKAFQQLMDFITSRLARYPDAHVYHYASYEETALKRLAMLHGTREVEVDNLLRGRRLIDLYKVVRDGMRISEPAYSIKNLETFYWPKRQETIKGGGDSIVAYEQWRAVGDKRLLQQILDYNEVDCKSTRGCRDWLLSLRPLEVEWFVPPDEDAEDPARLHAQCRGQYGRPPDGESQHGAGDSRSHRGQQQLLPARLLPGPVRARRAVSRRQR